MIWPCSWDLCLKIWACVAEMSTKPMNFTAEMLRRVMRGRNVYESLRRNAKRRLLEAEMSKELSG